MVRSKAIALRTARRAHRYITWSVVVSLLLPYPSAVADEVLHSEEADRAPDVRTTAPRGPLLEALSAAPAFLTLSFRESDSCIRNRRYSPSEMNSLQVSLLSLWRKCKNAPTEQAKTCGELILALDEAPARPIGIPKVRSLMVALETGRTSQLAKASRDLKADLGLDRMSAMKAEKNSCADTDKHPATVHIPLERTFLAQVGTEPDPRTVGPPAPNDPSNPRRLRVPNGPPIPPYRERLNHREKVLSQRRAAFFVKHATPGQRLGLQYAYGEWKNKAGGGKTAHEAFDDRKSRPYRHDTYPMYRAVDPESPWVIRENTNALRVHYDARFGAGRRPLSNPLSEIAKSGLKYGTNKYAGGLPVFESGSSLFNWLGERHQDGLISATVGTSPYGLTDPFSAQRHNPKYTVPIMEELIRSPHFAEIAGPALELNGKNILGWTHLDMMDVDPDYQSALESGNGQLQPAQAAVRARGELVDQARAGRAVATAILKDGLDPKNLLQNAHKAQDKLDEQGETPGPEQEGPRTEGEDAPMSEEDKQKVRDSYIPYQLGLEIAADIAGNNKPARAAIAVAMATVEIAILAQVATGAALSFGIVAVVYGLGRMLASIFGNSGPPIEQIILLEIQALRKQVQDMDIRLGRQIDETQYDIGALKLYIDDEFDRIEKRLRGDYGRINSGLRSVERTSQLGLARTSHLAQETQANFLDLVRRREQEATDFLDQGLVHLPPGHRFYPSREKLETEIFPQWLYRMSMNLLRRSATDFSRGAISAGTDVPQEFRGDTDTLEKFEGLRNFIANDLPHRNPAHNIRLVEKALELHGINITPEKPSYVKADSKLSEKYPEGAFSIGDWARNAHAYADIAGRSEEIYGDYYCSYDPNLHILRDLIDDGEYQLKALKTIAPPTSTGAPSVHQLIRLASSYDRSIMDIGQTIKLKGDREGLQKKLALINAFDNYDPEKPETVETIEKLASRNTGIELLATIGDYQIRPCPHYQPADGEGHLQRAAPLQLDPLGGVQLEKYIDQIPPVILAAFPHLQGKLELCYDDIKRVNDKGPKYRMERQNDAYAIVSDVVGNVGARIHYSYTPHREVRHTFSQKELADDEELVWRSTDLVPVFTDAAQQYEIINVKPGDNDPNRAIYDEATRRNKALTERGELVGYTKMGSLAGPSGVENNEAPRFFSRWNAADKPLEFKLYMNQVREVMPPSESNDSLRDIASLASHKLTQELTEFLSEEVASQVQSESGKPGETGTLGEALRAVEADRLLLEQALWMAFGDSISSDAELQRLMRNLPTKYDFVRLMLANQLAVTDEELRKVILAKMKEPLLELVSYLSDPKKSRELKTSHLAVESALDELRHLYLDKERDPRCSPTAESKPDFLRTAIGKKQKRTSATARRVAQRQIQAGGAAAAIELSPQQLALINEVVGEWTKKALAGGSAVPSVPVVEASMELMGRILREAQARRVPMSKANLELYRGFFESGLVEQMTILTAGGKAGLDLSPQEAADVVHAFEGGKRQSASPEALKLLVSAKPEEVKLQGTDAADPHAASRAVLSYIAPGQKQEQLEAANRGLVAVKLAVLRKSKTEAAEKLLGDTLLTFNRIDLKWKAAGELENEAFGLVSNPAYSSIAGSEGYRNLPGQISQTYRMHKQAKALKKENEALLAKLKSDKPLAEAELEAANVRLAHNVAQLGLLVPRVNQQIDYWAAGSIQQMRNLRNEIDAARNRPPAREPGPRGGQDRP